MNRDVFSSVSVKLTPCVLCCVSSSSSSSSPPGPSRVKSPFKDNNNNKGCAGASWGTFSFLLASVAAAANFGLCAAAGGCSAASGANSQREEERPPGASDTNTVPVYSAVTAAEEEEAAERSRCVYWPESRVEGLHDSFSNLLSWLLVPLCWADDIFTAAAQHTHTDTHTERHTQRERGGSQLIRNRAPPHPISGSVSQSREKKKKKTHTASAHTCCHVTDSWSLLTNRRRWEPPRRVNESRGVVYSFEMFLIPST